MYKFERKTYIKFAIEKEKQTSNELKPAFTQNQLAEDNI